MTQVSIDGGGGGGGGGGEGNGGADRDGLVIANDVDRERLQV